MVKIEVTIQDFAWPKIDCIVARGNFVQQLTIHHSEASEKLAEAVAASTKLAVTELLERHNPTVKR